MLLFKGKHYFFSRQCFINGDKRWEVITNLLKVIIPCQTIAEKRNIKFDHINNVPQILYKKSCTPCTRYDTVLRRSESFDKKRDHG